MTQISSQKLLDIPPITPTDPDSPIKGPNLTIDVEAAVESFNAVTAENAPLPSPSPVVQPTTNRSLRGQSSKSFQKGKDATLATPGSSASPTIVPRDVQAMVRAGMQPAAAGETAPVARARHSENEARLASFVVNLEQTVSVQIQTVNVQLREQTQQMQELALLVKEVRAACEQQVHSPALQSSELASSSMVDNPVVQQLHTALLEHRVRITELVSEMRQLKADAGGRDAHCLPSIPSIPSLPSTPLSSRPKRPFEDQAASPSTKRHRPGSQQQQDVLYGPVDPDGHPKTIANAAAQLITGIHPGDIFSAKYVNNQPGFISIRFKNSDSADRFVDSMERSPILEGQTAVFAGHGMMSPMAGPALVPSYGLASGLTPQDIIRGAGKTPRRR